MPTVWDKRIDYQCPCPSCGYDLFSRSIEGECPECGRRYFAKPPGPTLVIDRIFIREFLLTAFALAALQWLLRFAVFSWLCFPFYSVMAFPLSLVERMLPWKSVVIWLIASICNSMFWGIGLGAIVYAIRQPHRG